MGMVLPASYVEVEQEEMMYMDGGFYISNKVLKTTLLVVGMNPMSGVSAAVLAVGIRRVGTALGARLGLVGGPAGALFGGLIGIAVSGFAAYTVADALIQGKGINVGLKYTS